MARTTSARTLTFALALASKALERRRLWSRLLRGVARRTTGQSGRRGGRYDRQLAGRRRLAPRPPGRRASRGRDTRGLEVAQLALDVALELLAVFALERA